MTQGRINIPGLDEIVRLERERRDEAFWRYAKRVCGFRLGPLTLRKLHYLAYANDPIISGGVVYPWQIARFLLVCHPRYRFRRSFVLRKRILFRLAWTDYQTVLAGALKYVDDSFADAPGRTGEGRIIAVSVVAGYIHKIAANYNGFSRNDILDTPMQEIFQYLKLINADLMGDKFQDITRESIHRTNYISELNRKRREEAARAEGGAN